MQVEVQPCKTGIILLLAAFNLLLLTCPVVMQGTLPLHCVCTSSFNNMQCQNHVGLYSTLNPHIASPIFAASKLEVSGLRAGAEAVFLFMLFVPSECGNVYTSDSELTCWGGVPWLVPASVKADVSCLHRLTCIMLRNATGPGSILPTL